MIVGKIRNLTKLYKKSLHAREVLKSISSFLSRQGVRLLYVALPDEHKIKGLTPFEKERIQDWCFDINKYKDELPKLQRLYGDGVTEEYILSVFDGGVVVQGARRKVLMDFSSENQHIVNGRRITIGQPSNFHNTIFTHGACTWRGTGVADDETIASYLQAQLNQEYPDTYKVINSAIGRGSSLDDDFEAIKEQQYKEGDIVILGSHGREFDLIGASFFKRIGMAYIEVSSCFNRPHNYGEWFNDSTLHTNKRGNIVIAKQIFNTLNDSRWLGIWDPISQRKPHLPKDTAFLTSGTKIFGDNPNLIKFSDNLKPYKTGTEASVNGSIVMNCNPFTLGHRYLIEYAASQVDHLYIFVVEENRSYFTFDDRFELVRNGTDDLKNVTVLPSGNFIISATTFPGYFYKDNLKETKIDCSNDLRVFAQYIAPALNIKIRFAGEEPLDPVTNQYNEGMRDILPQYGIEFREIPRKKDNDGVGVISASRVRKYYENGEINQIKKIVPASTFDYLLARYQKEHPNG